MSLGRSKKPTTFHPFSRLPIRLQRRIWAFALPPGAEIIEAAFSAESHRLNPIAPPDRFISTSPYAGVLEVCGLRNDPIHKISPVNLTSLVKPGSGVRQ